MPSVRGRVVLALIVVSTVLALSLAPAATAHKLPTSYAKERAVKIIKRHFRAYPWNFTRVTRAQARNCKRLSLHKVRCRAYAEGYDPADNFVCRGRVTIRFVFPGAYTISGSVSRERCFPF